jgi:hypothetical protein
MSISLASDEKFDAVSPNPCMAMITFSILGPFITATVFKGLCKLSIFSFPFQVITLGLPTDKFDVLMQYLKQSEYTVFSLIAKYVFWSK